MAKGYFERYKEFCNSLEAMKALRKFYDGDYKQPFEADIQRDFRAMLLSSISSKFAITFELSWKLIKDILQENGIIDYAIGSPKQNIRMAASFGMITDREWMDMCDDRNQLAHDYDYQFIESISEKIFTKYIPLLENLKENADIELKKIQREWK